MELHRTYVGSLWKCCICRWSQARVTVLREDLYISLYDWKVSEQTRLGVG